MQRPPSRAALGDSRAGDVPVLSGTGSSMHPDATDSSGAGLSPAPAVGSPGERRPELRQDAAAPKGPDGGSWRLSVAAVLLAAVSLSYLVPGYWQGAGGAGPFTVLLRLILYLACAAAAFLLGTLFSLVYRSPRAPPPDFAATWRRLALATRRRPGVSTGLPTPRALGPRPGALRFRCQLPALGDPVVAVGLSSPALALKLGSPRATRLGLPARRTEASTPSAPAGAGSGFGGTGRDARF